jgi:hypothetical protein
MAGADDSKSAVYPFGQMWPGLPSQALNDGNGNKTVTFGFVAIQPGHTIFLFNAIDPMTGSPTGTQGYSFQSSVS